MSLRLAVGATVLLLLASALAVPATLATGSQAHGMTALPGQRVTVRAGQTIKKLRPIMRASRAGLKSVAVNVTATADIQVTYNGFSQEAQDAFQAAIDVWETQIVSTQLIHVDATWEPLPPGMLGSAGPNALYVLDDGHAYPGALAEALCSCEGNEPVEIVASFNSEFDAWYLGTDGNPSSNDYDFTTVVLHELGHGLGFLSSFEVSGTKGYWGLIDGATHYPLNFDLAEQSAVSDGVPLTNYSPAGTKQLKAELTDGSVYFGGANVVAAYGGPAPLYAPSPWSEGSSNSHFDEATFASGTVDALMTPQLDNGEVIHMPGPVTLALFRDIGWPTPDSGSSDNTPPVVTPAVGSIVEGQTLGTTALLHLAWLDATDESGITAYDLQGQKAGGPWNPVSLPFATATGVNVALEPNTNYTFRLRARDGVGNNSDWVMTGPAPISLLQETNGAIAYGGTWKRVGLSRASRGHVRKAGIAGYTATLSFTGSSVGFVSTRAASRGIAEMWLDDVFQESVDLYRAGTSKRWVIWAPDAPLIVGPHTLEVRVTGIHNLAATTNRIDVDAFLTWP